MHHRGGLAGFGSIAPLVGIVALGALILAPPGRASANHLYVTDARSATIFTYPFASGVLAPAPDGYVYVGLSIYGIAQATAIGPDGELYVAGQHTVQVYAPGARGMLPKPIRTLELEGTVADNMVLDAKSDLFVSVAQPGSGSESSYLLEAYRPFASGNTKPFARIPFHSDRPVGLSIGDGQRLFVADDFEPSRNGLFSAVIEYATPSSQPTEIRRLCSRYRIFSTAVTPGGRLFVAGVRLRGHGQNESIIGHLYVAHMRCPPPVYPTFVTLGATSLAVSPPSLFALGLNDDVVQYRIDANAPVLVKQLQRGPPSLFWFPNNVEVGP